MNARFREVSNFLKRSGDIHCLAVFSVMGPVSFFWNIITIKLSLLSKTLLIVPTKWNSQIIGNKAKGRISKRVFQENKVRQIFRKNNISYPLIRTSILKVRLKVLSRLNVLHKLYYSQRDISATLVQAVRKWLQICVVNNICCE